MEENKYIKSIQLLNDRLLSQMNIMSTWVEKGMPNKDEIDKLLAQIEDNVARTRYIIQNDMIYLTRGEVLDNVDDTSNDDDSDPERHKDWYTYISMLKDMDGLTEEEAKICADEAFGYK